VARESRKQAARRPRPPLPRPASYFRVFDGVDVAAEFGQDLLHVVEYGQVHEVIA
jgi:hypothetical protein